MSQNDNKAFGDVSPAYFYENAWRLPDRLFNKFYNDYGFVNGWSKFTQEKREDVRKKYGMEWRDIEPSVLTLKEYVEIHRTEWTLPSGRIGEYPLDLAIEDYRNYLRQVALLD